MHHRVPAVYIRQVPGASRKRFPIAMTDVGAPVLASVVVLAVHDLTRKTVAEQGRVRAQIEDLVRNALRPLPAAQRIVLDAPQGIVAVLLYGPGAALEFAERVQAGAAELPLCIGINYGPVTIAEDVNRGRALVGDGVAAGMTMAQAGAPARMMVSRPFQEALQAEDPDSAARLVPAGVHTDMQVRAHELFTLDQGAVRSERRRLAITGVVAFAGILALGVVARLALYGSGLRGAPAIIEFRVKPRGEIYVDGVLKGSTPPLARIEITSGHHTIEVRNSSYPPLKVEVNPGPAEEMTIAHSFSSRSGTKSGDKSLSQSAREGWRSFRRSVGF